jgi:cytochrome c-type biogenesis protein CcmH/NrfG
MEGDLMKLILSFTILLLVCLGTISQNHAQGEADFEETGLKHFGNAYFKAIRQKDQVQRQVEFSRAENAFKKAIESDPARVKPYLYLGRTYFVQKKYSAAADVYRQALTRAPQNNQIRLQLASALEKAGDYEGAIVALEDIRAGETDTRTIELLNHFINEMKLRAATLNQDNQ